jgi:hypothetical protein
VGSLISCSTSMSAALAAEHNASFCFSLKLVGTVITAEVTFLPR